MNPLKHLALIMDGNGRWSERRLGPRTRGHLAGARRAMEIVEYVSQTEIETLSLFAFSSENWKRPELEVRFLMHLIRDVIWSHLDSFRQHGVRFHMIGDREGLPLFVRKAVDGVEIETAKNHGLNLCVAINYSGQNDICRAVRELGRPPRKPQEIEKRLATAKFGPPDLIVRTGGEQRLSNFFLWQAAYAEIHFEEKLWPDFSCSDLQFHIEQYQGVERRFGGIPDNLTKLSAKIR